jgi:uncharacterized membrane protein HdeD (DUF308 family)
LLVLRSEAIMTISITENSVQPPAPPVLDLGEPRALGSSPDMIAHYPTSAWGAPMIFGIMMILIGIIAFSTVIVTSLVSVIVLGIFLVVAGTFELVSAVRHREYRSFVGYFVAGVLSVALGAVLVIRPLASLETLTMFVVGYLLAGALFRGAIAVLGRYSRWGWDVAYAVATLVLAGLVVASYPLSALWLIGAYVTLEIMVRGFALVTASATLRELSQLRR